MTRWEYLYLRRLWKDDDEDVWVDDWKYADATVSERLKKAGEEGWELVAVHPVVQHTYAVPNTSGIFYYFKRPL